MIARSACPLARGHANRSFYEPAEGSPLEEFGHSLGDGYVIVLYPQDLPVEDVNALREWELTATFVHVGPAPEADTRAITATTIQETLTCTEVEIEPLDEFLTTWKASVE